jgi:uracil-DNA glycosylase
MNVRIEESWKEVLLSEFEKEYFKDLANFVKEEYKNHTVYPPGGKIFEAFNKTPFNKVRVVIIGQDPYHGKGQANGLSFSVSEGTKLPPSLQNIFKEIKNDLGKESKNSRTGDLSSWAEQGVLLLNATLTVRQSSPGSHQKKGWETLTSSVIEKLSEKKNGLVYILWGKYAQEKGVKINTLNNLVLKAAHPSPFSADNGFFGCKHFSRTNEYLVKNGETPIEW